MQLGFSTMNTPDDVRADVLARALEERGYDSLFMGEHSHIPASRKTPYPAGGELPPQYLRMMDPFVSLTMAAMVTTTLRLGAGVALALEHDVMDLAKSAGTRRNWRTIARSRGRNGTSRWRSASGRCGACGVTTIPSSTGSSTTSIRSGPSRSLRSARTRR